MFGKYNLNNLQFRLRSKVIVASNPVAATLTSVIAPVSSKELLDIQAATDGRFTLKHFMRHDKNTRLN